VITTTGRPHKQQQKKHETTKNYTRALSPTKRAIKTTKELWKKNKERSNGSFASNKERLKKMGGGKLEKVFIEKKHTKKKTKKKKGKVEPKEKRDLKKKRKAKKGGRDINTKRDKKNPTPTQKP